MEQTKNQIKIKIYRLPLISFLITLIGVTFSLWGASWDVTSHLLRIPETFFTPSHTVLYIGVGISLISAILNIAILLTKKEVRKQTYAFGMKIIILGAILQIIAGPGDFYWHELFGIDGLLSPTHLTLALGVTIALIGSIIGFSRIYTQVNQKSNFLKMIIPVSFGVFWFNIMWMIFFFVLPVSDGDTFDFNPDPYFAIGLSLVALPFMFSIVFWLSFKIINNFGAASVSMLMFVVMNITSNIITSESLLFYLPWFVVPIICGILSDYVLNKKFNVKFMKKYKEKVSGAILGSIFFVLSFPMLSMTYLEPYLFNDVFSYDILHTSAQNVFEFWILSAIPGAIFGVLGMMLASRKLNHISGNVS